MKHCHVNVDDVALLELDLRTRYPVAHDLIDGRANTLGEAAVVERRGIPASLDRLQVHN